MSRTVPPIPGGPPRPHAARRLQVVASVLGDRAGVLGAARLVLEHVLAPAAVDRALAPLAHRHAAAGGR